MSSNQPHVDVVQTNANRPSTAVRDNSVIPEKHTTARAVDDHWGGSNTVEEHSLPVCAT